MKYEDIINIKHFEPKYHKRMSMENRAAQFSPFAALTGYEDNVKEASRKTHKNIYLTDDEKEIINMKLQLLEENIKERNEVSVTYFLKDLKKDGINIKTYSGILKKIDKVNKKLIFEDKNIILFDNIIDIKSNILNVNIKY